MNRISSNVKRIREQKGYPQDYMAVKMGMSQPKYSRIENGEARFSMKELQEIADLLETDISAFLDAPKVTIQNQTINDNANGYVENLHIENKEAIIQLIQAKDDIIQQLKDEIQHLKKEMEFLQSVIKPDMTEKEL